jgi:hypothetical protein
MWPPGRTATASFRSSREPLLIWLTVDRQPGGRDPKPVWLWWSRTRASLADVERLWRAFLRSFEHTFRLFKQVLGWTAPKIRAPQAADLVDHASWLR